MVWQFLSLVVHPCSPNRDDLLRNPFLSHSIRAFLYVAHRGVGAAPEPPWWLSHVGDFESLWSIGTSLLWPKDPPVYLTGGAVIGTIGFE